MYNLNERKGKEERIKKLKELIIKVARRELTLEDEQEIIKYLGDIKQDLEGQLFMEGLNK